MWKFGELTTRSRLLLGVALCALPLIANDAYAQSFQGLGTPSLSDGSQSLSADGAVVIGMMSGDRSFRWSGGVLTDLGVLGGGTFTHAYAISGDGRVIVGQSGDNNTNQRHAFLWSAGVIQDLGTLGGAALWSEARGASYDGTVLTGYSQWAGGAGYHAFRWTGGVMTDLGTLGGANSYGLGISADSSVIVGKSTLANFDTHAFKWTGGVMTDLGTLGGNLSSASSVSADGSVIVGSSNLTGNTVSHAVKWSGSVIADLGTLGGTNSNAVAVSSNGLVIVGSSDTPLTSQAFRWTAGTGMQSIATLLTNTGVNLTGWSLYDAAGVSSDGSVISGNGASPNLSQEVWIARFSPQGNGIITMSEVARSFASVGAVGQTSAAAIGSTLGTMTQYATQGMPEKSSSPFSIFANGAYDTDPTGSGSLGATYRFGDTMMVGATVGADFIKTNMSTSGSANMSGATAGSFVARIPETGLQWLVGLSGITLKGTINRGYLNGNTPTISSGDTAANGYGITGRVGWTFDALANVKITPFASYTFSDIRYDGYTETTGVFAAVINDFNDRAHTSRLGSDVRYTIAPGAWLWGTAAWAHRLNSGRSADIAGTVIGLFPLGTQGFALAKDWTELTAGARIPLWRNGSATASATASVTPNQTTTYLLRAGVAQAF